MIGAKNVGLVFIKIEVPAYARADSRKEKNHLSPKPGYFMCRAVPFWIGKEYIICREQKEEGPEKSEEYPDAI